MSAMALGRNEHVVDAAIVVAKEMKQGRSTGEQNEELTEKG